MVTCKGGMDRVSDACFNRWQTILRHQQNPEAVKGSGAGNEQPGAGAGASAPFFSSPAQSQISHPIMPKSWVHLDKATRCKTALAMPFSGDLDFIVAKDPGTDELEMSHGGPSYHRAVSSPWKCHLCPEDTDVTHFASCSSPSSFGLAPVPAHLQLLSGSP